MPVSAEEIRRAFRARVKAQRCPSCDLPFTDFACDWSEAWAMGRREALHECGREERDGPIKLQCEICGERAVTDVFLSALKPSP